MENRLLLGFVLFSLASIGLVNAYGEPLTANVQVYSENRTITLEHPVDLEECEKFQNEYQVFTQCLFLYNIQVEKDNPNNLSTETDNGCLEGYVRDVETNECKLPEVIQSEALEKCYNDIHCPVGLWEDEDGNIVNNQEKIDENPYQQKGDDSIPDGVFMCGRDIALYQDGTQYETPTESWIDADGKFNIRILIDGSMKSIDLSAYPEIKADRMAAQECIAQYELKQREAIDQRLTVPNSSDIFFEHKDIAQFIPPITAERVNVEANKDFENLSLQNIFCNGYYDQRTKQAMGCGTDYPTGDPTLIQPMKNVISPEMEREINNYNQDGGIKMAKELQKEHILEQIRMLQNQLRGLP